MNKGKSFADNPEHHKQALEKSKAAQAEKVKKRVRAAVAKVESIGKSSLEHLQKRMDDPDCPDDVKDQIAMKMGAIYAQALVPQVVVHKGDENNPIQLIATDANRKLEQLLLNDSVVSEQTPEADADD